MAAGTDGTQLQFHQERTMDTPQQQPQPSKQQLVRSYMERRRVAGTPPPDIHEVRRQVGWGLTGAEVQECSR